MLTVATYGSAAPALVILPHDQLGALDGAGLTAFAKDHGLRLRLYQTTCASVILAVKQGKADAGPYYYCTQYRARQVCYTYPFFQEHATVLTVRSVPYSGRGNLREPFGGNAALVPNSTAGEPGQIDGWVNSDDRINDPVLSASRDGAATHLLTAGDFGFPKSVIDDEMTTRHKTGRWAGVLRDTQLTATNDVPLQAPAQLCSPT